MVAYNERSLHLRKVLTVACQATPHLLRFSTLIIALEACFCPRAFALAVASAWNAVQRAHG